jgi:peptidoglycan glycosyltransferase
MGQGELQVTPLQMALIAAAVANQGVMPAPHLVSDVRARNGEVLFSFSPHSWRVPIDAVTAQQITSAMEAAVESGWAGKAKIPGVRVAGKTGTAQAGDAGPAHAWFIGFAPVDNPTIAVAVIKEHAGYGSLEAAPIAAQVFAAYLSP